MRRCCHHLQGLTIVEIKPIRTEADYQDALLETETLMDSLPDTPEGDRLEMLATLISEVLHRKRRLSLAMIQRLHAGLGIPADLLIGAKPRRVARPSSQPVA